MPLRWTSCLFRPRRETAKFLEFNTSVCPSELQEELVSRGTSCLRPRGAQVIYERVHDAGFTPPVIVYIKHLSLGHGMDVCIKRTLVTHFVGRAVREARLQVQLNHPHLLSALASARSRRHYYLVLPAAEGDLWAELEGLVQHGSGYTEDELRSLARQVLLGLEQLHAMQLAHRDIKPTNVLRMPDGRVVVADFGCADGCTAGFVAAGTTQFQPPECRRNPSTQLAVLPKGYDQRTQDMWSVGATLAALWLGALPKVVRGGGWNPKAGAGDGAAGTVGASRLRHSATAASSARYAGDEVSIAMAAARQQPSKSYGPMSYKPLDPAPVEDGAAAYGTGTKTCAGVSDGERSSPEGRSQMPGFLVAAGFGACSSAAGACGEPMSDDLQDLLAGLLRLRPTERLTAQQALQHAWLRAEGTQVDLTTPRRSAQPAAAPASCSPAAPTLTTSPPSLTPRVRAAISSQLLSFHSKMLESLELRQSSERAIAVGGEQGGGRVEGARGGRLPATPGQSPFQQPQGLKHQRRYFGRSANLSNDDSSSPIENMEDSQGKHPQRVSSGEQEQEQPLQEKSQAGGDMHPAWLQPSTPIHQAKRGPRTLLRVFVGAEGDAPGSN